MSLDRPLDDAAAMRLAITLAHEAAVDGETAVGAVIMRGGEVVGTGRERTRRTFDLTAHAEVNALRDASRRLQAFQLAGCTLYTTVEPCVLCGYAIRRAAIARVVYGVAAGQAGAVTSRYGILTDADLHGWPAPPEILGGVLSAECGQALGRNLAGGTSTHGSAPDEVL